MFQQKMFQTDQVLARAQSFWFLSLVKVLTLFFTLWAVLTTNFSKRTLRHTYVADFPLPTHSILATSHHLQTANLLSFRRGEERRNFVREQCSNGYGESDRFRGSEHEPARRLAS